MVLLPSSPTPIDSGTIWSIVGLCPWKGHFIPSIEREGGKWTFSEGMSINYSSFRQEESFHPFSQCLLQGVNLISWSCPTSMFSSLSYCVLNRMMKTPKEEARKEGGRNPMVNLCAVVLSPLLFIVSPPPLLLSPRCPP